MSEKPRNLKLANGQDEPTPTPTAGAKRRYIDPLDSDKRGLAGVLERLMRNFKTALHLILITPIYAVVGLTLGAAAAPGIYLFEQMQAVASTQTGPIHYILQGAALAAGYFGYGFTLLFIVPAVNFVLRLNLKPWRGSYYSIETIRWYIHNGFTYLVRYTFLEFVTPTPFNILFYKMMGMKIGRGTAINTTWISDPSLIELGEKVTIGGSVHLVAHYGQGGYLVLAPVKIGDRVTIGLKATVMGGVTIGAGAKVLPSSVVMPKTVIPEGETWGGVPARKID